MQIEPRRLPHLLPAIAAAALLWGCAPPMHSTLSRPPTPAELSALWVDPAGQPPRDGFYGSGGKQAAPSPDVVYRFVENKSGGFSPKMEVVDPSGRKWSVKLGPEAQSEVTASRISWLLGYQQPPGYYLEHWQIARDTGVHHMGPGRFRPHLDWIESKGTWSWQANPFAGSDPLRGLIVLMMVLNSTDLKADNNEVYRVRKPDGTRQQWYTVKDLGASLGETGRVDPRRNNIEFFEKQAFITGMDGPYVRFEFHGRHQDLIQRVRPADVRWICLRLDRLTPRQWQDAFRSGGYDDATTARYIAKIQAKVQQGLSLAEGPR